MSAPDKIMKRVRLSLSAGVDADNMSLTPVPVAYDFIFGAGTAGLTSFETAIYNLQPEDVVDLHLSAVELKSFFGSMYGPIREALNLLIMPDALCLRVKMLGCEDVSPREIVKYLAKASQHGGCGCDDNCGCGC